MFNKRGISDIVATVLIILVTVAAATIVWVTVIPMIKNQLSSGTDCFQAVTQIEIGTTAGYTCLNATNQSINVQVKMKPGDASITSLQFLIYQGGSTITKKLSDAIPTTLVTQNAEKVYKLVDAQFSSGVTAVAVAPIIKTGNQERTCDATTSVTLSACA